MNYKDFLPKELYRNRRKEAEQLVNKWARTGLLEGLKGVSRGNMAQLLENQAVQLLREANTTGTTANSEEWSGIALPLVRRIFADISAKEFVSVQPMNMPTGLVFWLDFKYGTGQPGFTTGAGKDSQNDSVFGVSDPNKGTGADYGWATPSEGLYGPGRFGYTINDYTSSAIASNGGSASDTNWVSASLSASDYNFNSEFSQSLLVGGSRVHKIVVSTGSLSNPDLNGIRGFTLSNGWGYNGGGAYCEPLGILTNCVLTGNWADGYGGGVYGGTLKNCTLTGNHVYYSGGGACSSTLLDCTLTGNSAEDYGGGAASSTLYNCALTGNSAYSYTIYGKEAGGGASGCTLSNCTLTRHSAGRRGGGGVPGGSGGVGGTSWMGRGGGGGVRGAGARNFYTSIQACRRPPVNWSDQLTTPAAGIRLPYRSVGSADGRCPQAFPQHRASSPLSPDRGPDPRPDQVARVSRGVAAPARARPRETARRVASVGARGADRAGGRGARRGADRIGHLRARTGRRGRRARR